MKYFTPKEIAFLGMMAAANSAVEISLGSLMHSLHIPGKSIILVTINMIIYFAAIKATGKKGSIIITGFITAFIKLIYGWEFSKLGPAFAIFSEAAIMELCVMLMPLKSWSSIVTGGIVKAYAMYFPLVSYLIFGGGKGAKVLKKLITDIEKIFPAMSFELMVAAATVWNIIIGAALGYIAYKTAEKAVEIYKTRSKTA